MNRLICEADALLKNGGFEYAFCGGQALDLFLGYESRVHGDIDICAFWKDRDRIIRYMQAQGFEVYEMLGGGRAHRITDISAQNNGTESIHCADNSGLTCSIGTIEHRRAQTLNILAMLLDIE